MFQVKSMWVGIFILFGFSVQARMVSDQPNVQELQFDDPQPSWTISDVRFLRDSSSQLLTSVVLDQNRSHGAFAKVCKDSSCLCRLSWTDRQTGISRTFQSPVLSASPQGVQCLAPESFETELVHKTEIQVQILKGRDAEESISNSFQYH